MFSEAKKTFRGQNNLTLIARIFSCHKNFFLEVRDNFLLKENHTLGKK